MVTGCLDERVTGTENYGRCDTKELKRRTGIFGLIYPVGIARKRAVCRQCRASLVAFCDSTLGICFLPPLTRSALVDARFADAALRVLACGCLFAGRRPACSRLGIQTGGGDGFPIARQAGR
jgi:hypothetical protein